MRIRFHIDPETGEPHVESHGVAVDEAEQVLGRPLFEYPGKNSARIAVGQTADGRYLRVVFVRNTAPDSIFVVTAYDLPAKALKALRRRLRR